MAPSTDPLAPPAAASALSLSAASPASAPRGLPLATGFTQSALTALREALSCDWVVESIMDPTGEVSLVVLAVDDDPLLPNFLLHQRNLVPHVAAIADDAWQSDQAFGSWLDAAATIVAMARTARPPGGTAMTRPPRGLRAA